jgi:hypothetical protein
MKYLLVIIFTLGVFVQNSNAQNSELVGSWLLIKVETDGKIQKPYQVTEFTTKGKMVMMGMEVAVWKYNKKTNSVEMESDFDEDFSGVAKIVKLDKDELIFEKDNTKIFYQKLDKNKITSNNKNSGLLGIWFFKGEPFPYANTYLTFKEPDEFTMIQKQEGMESSSEGTWIFDNKEMVVILIGLRGEDMLKGENNVLNVSDESLNLENNGKVFKANKKVKKAGKDGGIEHLTFTEDDFYNENGDFKYYDHEEKLPWRNWSEMKTGLLNVKQLVYNYSTMLSGSETFETKTLTADVKATLEEEGFSIDNVFNGYDRYNLPDDSEFYVSSEYTYPLYPVEDDVFRVVGNEEITTPAGTFACTVLEGINDSGALKKLWMINDKIGVYDKIIDEDPDETWGHYKVYELKTIE